MGRRDWLNQQLRRDICRFLLRGLMRFLLRVQFSGSEHIPKTGPAIILINHIAFLDPVVVCGLLDRYVTPVAKREAFDIPIIGLLLRFYGTVPVHRGQADVAAVKTILRILKRGGVVLLAPEGTRSPTHNLQSGKEGAVIFALRSGAPLLPIGITGTERLKSHWFRWRRAPVNLSIGPPFYLLHAPKKGRVSRQETAKMIQETMYRLAAELPKPYRGIYANLDTATETYITKFANDTSFEDHTPFEGHTPSNQIQT